LLLSVSAYIVSKYSCIKGMTEIAVFIFMRYTGNFYYSAHACGLVLTSNMLYYFRADEFM